MPAKLDRCVKSVTAKGDVDEPYAVCNAAIKEDHEFPYAFPAINSKDATKEACKLEEQVAIGGGLSAQGVGGKKIEEEISCPKFDKMHEALMQETHNPLDIPMGKEMPTGADPDPVEEGGPGSGKKGHTTPKDEPSGGAPSSSDFNANEMTGGDIVAFRDPFADGTDERASRMVVMDDQGDRVVIKDLQSDLPFPPTMVISKDQLINANQDSPELAKATEDPTTPTFDPMNDPVPTNTAGEENPFLADVKRKAKGQLHGFSPKGPGAKSGTSTEEGGEGSGPQEGGSEDFRKRATPQGRRQLARSLRLADPQFDKVHEALMKEGGQGSGRKSQGGVKDYAKPFFNKKAPYGKTGQDNPVDRATSRSIAGHQEAKNPFESLDMDVSAGSRNPSKTLDPEPSDKGHRDPKKTLDPEPE